MAEIFDIAIIGGGIVGASLAHALGGRRSVVLLEQEDFCGYHATGRSAAEFTLRFHSEGAGRLTRASAGFLHTPPDGFCDTALLRPRGNLVIADKEKADHLKQVFAQEDSDTPGSARPITLQSVPEALARVPFLDPDWLGAAFYDPDCWDVEVETLLQSYLKSARKSGAEIRQGTGVTTAHRHQTGWRLETTGGEVLAQTIVNAAGAWADPVAGLFGVPALGLIPNRRTAISVKAKGFDLTDMPEVTEIDEVFYFKPDAGQLMVSPADETPVTAHDAWPEELDIAYAAHYLGECTTLDVTHIAHSWAGLRTISPDHLPVIGFSGQADGVFWLAGLGGFGIQTSVAVGQLAAGLLTGEALPKNITSEGIMRDTFSPARFGG